MTELHIECMTKLAEVRVGKHKISALLDNKKMK